MNNYRISLIGFGGVNRALVKLIAEHNDEWAQTLGFQLTIVGISDLFLGSIISPNGIDPKMLCGTTFEKSGFSKLSGGSADADSLRVIREAPADIVVEATFTDAKTAEPAVSYCRAALEAGRSVVTTNKGPVALFGNDLKALAESNRVGFEFEGAVMSGTPVIRHAKQLLAGANIRKFAGILNGTSNYVIGQMENGMALEEAVKEAQDLGYAEADPTADIEGFDVRLKVVILSQELFGVTLKPEDVPCEGISSITKADIAEADAQDMRWKLIGSATRNEDGSVTAGVAPQKIATNHPLAGISQATNAVCLTTDLLGDVTISGPGAGRVETAFALLSDIVALHSAGAAPTQEV